MHSTRIYFNNIGSVCTDSQRHGNGLSALLLLTRAAKSSAAKSSAAKTRSMESRLYKNGKSEIGKCDIKQGDIFLKYVTLASFSGTRDISKTLAFTVACWILPWQSGHFTRQWVIFLDSSVFFIAAMRTANDNTLRNMRVCSVLVNTSQHQCIPGRQYFNKGPASSQRLRSTSLKVTFR